MKNRAWLTLTLIPLLSGCFIRNARMERKLKPWMGRPIQEAVSEFGPPSETFPNGLVTLYVWRYTGPTVASANFYRYGATSYAFTTGCRIWFDVDDAGSIVGWHWEGRC